VATATTQTSRATIDPYAGVRRRRGFTLIEIVVVITIIAVAAAITIPSLGAGQRQREIRRTLQTFVSTVRRASSVSVFQRRPVELRLHPRERRYEIVTRESAFATADTRAATPRGRSVWGRAPAADGSPGDAGMGFSLPALASFGSVEGGRDLGREGIVFDFYPNGSSSGGKIEFVFDAGRGRPTSHVVVVNPLVSSISLED
jgi:type II secretion system protein H